MIKALLRFIFFEIPSAFISGISYILFDKEEVIDIRLTVRDQYNKADEENRILIEYLNRCRKQIYKGK